MAGVVLQGAMGERSELQLGQTTDPNGPTLSVSRSRRALHVHTGALSATPAECEPRQEQSWPRAGNDGVDGVGPVEEEDGVIEGKLAEVPKQAAQI